MEAIVEVVTVAVATVPQLVEDTLVAAADIAEDTVVVAAEDTVMEVEAAVAIVEELSETEMV